MKQALAFIFVGILTASLYACAGGGGGSTTGRGTTGNPPPPVNPPTRYGAQSYALGNNCAFAVGSIVTNASSSSSAESSARQSCMLQARNQAASAGVQAPTCTSGSFTGCAAIAVGQNSSRRCNLRGHARSTLSAARSAAIQNCQNRLGSSANCEILASACATGRPDSGVWRSSTTPTPPPGGVGSGQVGREFGRTSTSGRTFNLTCTNDVVFQHSGNVVLPSVEVVTLPAAAGTITFEYDAYDIPDRFVVELGGRVVVDTRYVGTSRSVAEVNAVLARYGFTRTSQSAIISPGSGSRSIQKPAGVTSAIVRVYAPLQGTAWEVTLKYSGSSCGSGPGTGQSEIVFQTNDNCNDGRNVVMSFSYYRDSTFVNWATQNRVAGGANTVTRVSCNFGNVNRVCYGARIDGTTYYFGHDLDRSKGCSDCCWQCTPGIGSRTVNLNFGCP